MCLGSLHSSTINNSNVDINLNNIQIEYYTLNFKNTKKRGNNHN